MIPGLLPGTLRGAMRGKYSKISLRKILSNFLNHTHKEEFINRNFLENLAMGLREGQQSDEFGLCVYTTDVSAQVRFYKATLMQLKRIDLEAA